MPTYLDIPTSEKFKSDSSVFLSIRSSDKTIVHIDKLLLNYQSATPTDRADILYYLYLGIRYWLKHAGEMPQHKLPTGYTAPHNPLPTNKNSSNVSRLQPMTDLYTIVNTKLYDIYGVNTPLSLADALTDAYLCDNHSILGDNNWLLSHPDDGITTIHITDDGVRRRFKLRIRGGLAYRWRQYDDATAGYALFDTTDNSESEIDDEFCHFAMDKRGRIFAGFAKDVIWFKHSSLLGGEKGQAAGRMKAIQGKITRINNDSGHYNPGARQMVNILQRLSIYGFDLTNMKVIRTFPDKVTFTAVDVVNALSKWPDE